MDNTMKKINLDLNLESLNKSCNLIMKIINKKIQWDRIVVLYEVPDRLQQDIDNLEVKIFDKDEKEYDLALFVPNENLSGNSDYFILKNIFKNFYKESPENEWNILKFQFDRNGSYHYEAYIEDNSNTASNDLQMQDEETNLITEIQNEIDQIETKDQAVELLEEIPVETHNLPVNISNSNVSSEVEAVKQKVEKVLNNTISYFQLLELVRNKAIPYKINCLDKNYVFDGITYVEENIEPFASSLLQNLLKDKAIGEEALTNLRMIKIVEWEYNSEFSMTDTLFINDILSS